jgi:hypothetical protein
LTLDHTQASTIFFDMSLHKYQPCPAITPQRKKSLWYKTVPLLDATHSTMKPPTLLLLLVLHCESVLLRESIPAAPTPNNLAFSPQLQEMQPQPARPGQMHARSRRLQHAPTGPPLPGRPAARPQTLEDPRVDHRLRQESSSGGAALHRLQHLRLRPPRVRHLRVSVKF